MCTDRPQWMSISQQKFNYKSKSYRVKCNLMDILKVDPERKVVTVEPLVTVGRLIDALIPMGWTIPIVPELGNVNNVVF